MSFPEHLRYEYPDLTAQSVVIDCGGYEGDFAHGIHERYGCKVIVFEPMNEFYQKIKERFASMERQDILVNPMGIAARDRVATFHKCTNATGEHAEGDEERVVLLGVDHLWKACDITQCDLLKLNIEGGEFEVMEALIDQGIAARCRNIQVQWHDVIPHADVRRDAILRALEKTHELTWDYGWTWQNWKLKSMNFISHSQAGQDRFAFELCGASGIFMDIGASDPVKLSNTYALEQFGWLGLLLECDPGCVQRLSAQRKSTVIDSDASQILFGPAFNQTRLDYLSLDVDESSLKTLQNLLPQAPRIKCMTVEHDAYRFGDERRLAMVELLKVHGYDILCDQVCNEGMPFEIWAVAPELVDMAKAERFRRSDPTEWSEFFA